VVEIDITSSSKIRFPVYAELGVPEVWVYDGESFSINVLRDKEYVLSERSLAFPNVPVLEISRFLQQAGTEDYLELVRAFRSWVKSQIQPNP
jgi:Uma2 family endonuclease